MALFTDILNGLFNPDTADLPSQVQIGAGAVVPLTNLNVKGQKGIWMIQYLNYTQANPFVATSITPGDWTLSVDNGAAPTVANIQIPDDADPGIYRIQFITAAGNAYQGQFFAVTTVDNPFSPAAPVPFNITDVSAQATTPNPLLTGMASYRLEIFNPLTNTWATAQAGLTAGQTGTASGLTPATSGYKMRFVAITALGSIPIYGDESDAFATLATGGAGGGVDLNPAPCGPYQLGCDISAAYKDHLSSNVTHRCSLYKITRRDGRVFGYTDFVHDINGDDITRGGATYPELAGIIFKAGAGITPTDIKSSTELNADNMQAQLIFDDEEITERDAHAGLFDGATVLTAECNWSDLTQGIKKLQDGNVGEVSWDRQKFSAQFQGLKQRLERNIIPLTSLMCRCDHFGDARCRKDLNTNSKDGYAITKLGTVATVDTANRRWRFTSSDIAGYPAKRFAMGRVRITTATSKNKDIWRKIKENDGATLTLWEPFPWDIEIGDTFEAICGCDRTIKTCGEIYGNGINFNGEPYIPGAKMYDIIEAD